MSGRPSGLRPPAKITASRPSGLPLGTSNIPNIVPVRHGGSSTGSTHPSPSLSMSSLPSKDGEVLNNKTDDLIIGEVIWVGGVKRGKIAFIGETQFSKGDWAGIVLDEPIGKNDGSVSGQRYFQCEPNHGTFVRLTRLTREPLVPIDPNDCGVHGSATPRCFVERQRSPSPAALKSPSPGLTTPRQGSPGPQLKLDERVIVQSSTGTKRGILRFVGQTEFANGEWAGIELDQPVGKNDGAVGGRRYFNCRDKYGLFAPIHKVTSSPANKHSAGGMRRHGSRESMGSNMSSIASSLAYRSVRAVLKEKEKHIERLLQERELDSQDLAQNLRKLEEAKGELSQLKVENIKCLDDSFKSKNALQSKLEEMQKEVDNGKLNVEEIQRKYEDLLFKYEEEQIAKSELQSQLEINIQGDSPAVATAQCTLKHEDDKTTNLIAAIQNENKTAIIEIENFRQEILKKNNDLEKLNAVLVQTEAENSKASKDKLGLQREIDNLNKQIEEQNMKISTVQTDLNQSKAQSTVVQAQETEKFKHEIEEKCSIIEQLRSSLLKLEAESSTKSKAENEYKTEIETLTQNLESLKLEASNLKKNLTTSSQELDNKTRREVEGKEEIESLQRALKENIDKHKLELENQVKELENKNSIILALKQSEEDLKKFIEKAKLDAESQHKLELDHVVKDLHESQGKCAKLEKVLENFKHDSILKLKLADETGSKKAEELQLKLNISDQKVVHLERLLERMTIESQGTASQIEEKNKQVILELSKDIKNKDQQMDTLMSEIGKLKIEVENNLQKLSEAGKASETLQQEIIDRDKQLEVVSSEISNLKQEHSKISNAVLEASEKETKLLNDLKLLNETNDVLNKKLEIAKQGETRAIESQNGEISRLKALQQDKIDGLLKELEGSKSIASALTACESDLKALKKDKESIQLQYDAVAKDLKESHSMCAELKQQIEHSSETYASKHTFAENELKEKESACRKLELLLAESQQKLSEESLKNKVELDQAVGELKTSKEKVTQYENSLEKMKLEILKGEEDHKCMLKLNEDLQNKQTQIEKLLTEISSLKTEREQFIENTAKADQVTGTMNSHIESLQKQNEDLRNEIIESKARESAMIEAQREEITRLKTSQIEAVEELQRVKSSQKQNQETVSASNSQFHSPVGEEPESSNASSINNEAHVNFLNSIIVDLQKERDLLKGRLEVLLHGGQLPDANSNVKTENASHNLKNLRVYCDICEEFDVHDTEDCPKQSNDPDVNSKHNAERNTERPYCDICEVFGHWTTDCDDGETY